MTTTARPIIPAQYAPSTQATVYTAGTGTRVICDKFTAYNSDTASQTLAVNIIPSGGSAGASNLIVLKTLTAGETYTFPEVVGHVLEAGGFISVVASAASKIVIRGSGREIT